MAKWFLRLFGYVEVNALDPISDLKRAITRASWIKSLESEVREICAKQVAAIDLTEEIPPTLRTGKVST